MNPRKSICKSKQQHTNMLQQQVQETTPLLFVSSIPFNLSNETLLEYFSRFGEVEMFKIHKRRTENKKSTGLLKMVSTQSFTKVTACRRHTIGEYDIFVDEKLAKKELVLKNEDTARRRMYVTNLQLDTSGNDLIRLFSVFGEVEMAYTRVPTELQNSKVQKNSIYGFVTFYDEKVTQKVIKMQAIKFDELEEPVQVSSFKIKSTRLTLEYYNMDDDERCRAKEMKRQKSSEEEDSNYLNLPTHNILRNKLNTSPESVLIKAKKYSPLFKSEDSCDEDNILKSIQLESTKNSNNHKKNNVDFNRKKLASYLATSANYCKYPSQFYEGVSYQTINPQMIQWFAYCNYFREQQQMVFGSF